MISSYAAFIQLSMIYVGGVNAALISKLFFSDYVEARILGLLILIAFLVYLNASLRSSRLFNNLVTARMKEHDLATKLEKEKQISEEANQSKSEFLAAASHDLRQPVDVFMFNARYGS